MSRFEYPYVPRRAVTGVREGKSVFISDGRAPSTREYEAIPGTMTSLVYATASGPTLPPAEEETAPRGRAVLPGPGETTMLIMTFGPQSVMSAADFDLQASLTEQDEWLPGLLDYFEPTGMHRTPTIDYDIVLNGEMSLELDDETRTFTTGDVVIQGATRHCWRNLGDEPATMCFIFVGGEEK